MPNIGGIIKLFHKSLQLAIIKNKRYICVYTHRITRNIQEIAISRKPLC